MPKPEDVAKKPAKKKSDSKPFSARVPFQQMRFIRLELSAGDKEAFKNWLAEDSDYTLDVDTSIREGYELTIKLDTDGSGMLASLRAPYVDSPNSGGILTGRGGTATRALQVLAFKIDYLVGGRTWEEAENSRRSDLDDIG